jgi:hypothetical protein
MGKMGKRSIINLVESYRSITFDKEITGYYISEIKFKAVED